MGPVFVTREDPEFDKMFEVLGEHFDANYECPDTGEVWQYMGTYHFADGYWRNCFRHRSYKDGERKHFNPVVSDSFLEKIPQLLQAGG